MNIEEERTKEGRKVVKEMGEERGGCHEGTEEGRQGEGRRISNDGYRRGSFEEDVRGMRKEEGVITTEPSEGITTFRLK